MFPIVAESLQRYKDTHPDSGTYITIEPDNITHRFEHILNQAGCPHYRFHDLRHYTVSVMLSLNVPINYVSGFVGHSSSDMVEKVYSHLLASKKTSVEDQLQAYFDHVLH
jgi:integrase